MLKFVEEDQKKTEPAEHESRTEVQNLHLNKPADSWNNDETRDQYQVWRRPNSSDSLSSTVVEEE